MMRGGGGHWSCPGLIWTLSKIGLSLQMMSFVPSARRAHTTPIDAVNCIFGIGCQAYLVSLPGRS
jgi:hypothetical protein